MPSTTINNTLGALEIGLILSSMFYGVTCVQVYHYANSPANDRSGIKWTVYILWLLETLHMGLLIGWFYGVSVTQFGVAGSYANLNWTYCAAIMFHAVLGTLVQCFFAWRIWNVSGHRIYLALPPVIMSFIRCALAFFIAVEFAQLGERGFRLRYTWSWILAQILNTVTDIWNAVALVLFLHSQRRSEYKQTNAIINRIMLFSFETGAVTAGLALTLCLTWACMPHNEVWNGVLIIYTRINANAVLVALNSRRRQSGVEWSESGAARSRVGEIDLGPLSFAPPDNEPHSPTSSRKTGILVETETIQIQDKEYTL